MRNAIKSFKWLVVSCNFGLLLLSIIQRNVEYCTNRGQFDDKESRSAFEIFFDWEFRRFEFWIEKDKRQRDPFEMLVQPSEPLGLATALFHYLESRALVRARPLVHSSIPFVHFIHRCYQIGLYLTDNSCGVLSFFVSFALANCVDRHEPE